MFFVVTGLLSVMFVINAVQSFSQLNYTLFFEDSNELNEATKQNNTNTIKDVENAISSVLLTDSVNGRTRIPLCCPFEHRLTNNECVETNGTFRFPPLYNSNNFTLIDENPDYQRYFLLFVRDPCVGHEHYKLSPDQIPEDAFIVLDNGSIYKLDEGDIIRNTDYCFDIGTDAYDVTLCFDSYNQQDLTKVTVVFPVGMIVSIPFLFATFMVYTLIPELKNMHGRTLRGYIASLLIAYVILAIVQISPQEQISDLLCTVFAFIIHYSFLASFFWLNVMCFDIWCAFRGFRSLQENMKQQQRKKFILYSIYAWGCASIFTGISIIMDSLPDIPEYFIKPEFGKQSCWFATDEAKAIYFYGPMGITVLCNIYFFISTALKIVLHQTDIGQHLKGADSRRHDDDKQWFSLYLKLFIMMGINWSMEIISWLCNNSPVYIWYLTDVTNTLQGVIIFLIFVWKDKVRRSLLKRFNYQKNNASSSNSYQCNYNSIGFTSETHTTQETIDN